MESNSIIQETQIGTVSKRFPVVVMLLLLLFVCVVSVSTLTTKPRLWTDEALSIELAKNFAAKGILDFQYAPNAYTGFPYLLQSTGYPTTAPLALVFNVFGFSFTLARIYMLLWMLAALAVVYRAVKKFFDPHLALLSVLLLATFASFHANGRTVVGDIPGLLFLLLALYWWIQKKSYVVAGVCMGLALVAKPSVFLLLLPAVFLVLIREPRRVVPRVLQIGLGMVPAGFIALALVIKDPLSASFWKQMVTFYRNPYSSDISQNILHNLAGFFHSTTLIYFTVLFLALLSARFLVKHTEMKWLYDFVGIYSMIALVYYLRSPGWLRYVLIAELLILIVLPHAIFTLACFLQNRVKFLRTFKMATLTVYAVAALALVQTVQMFTAADIFASDQAIVVAQHLDRVYGHARVAVIDNAGIYALLTNPQRETVLTMTGVPLIGANPFLDTELPRVIVSSPSSHFLTEAKEVLSNRYHLVENQQGFDVFELQP